MSEITFDELTEHGLAYLKSYPDSGKVVNGIPQLFKYKAKTVHYAGKDSYLINGQRINKGQKLIFDEQGEFEVVDTELTALNELKSLYEEAKLESKREITALTQRIYTGCKTVARKGDRTYTHDFPSSTRSWVIDETIKRLKQMGIRCKVETQRNETNYYFYGWAEEP